MEPHRLNSVEDPAFAACWSLYEAAFPRAERRSLACQRAAMECADFHCYCLTEEGHFAGLAFYWQMPQGLYVEHLAIPPERRGQGLGHQALDWLCGQGLPVILEIEPVVDAPTERRWRFYRSAGFHRLPFPHRQPLYHHGDEPMELTLLSYPRAMKAEEITAYERFMQAVVAHYTEDGLMNA